ncbi:T9SS type A sorting domain-containing protein [Ignavibacterium sp.]|uniref:T9SS type A sorting domain-containing protein n=1 Tax=Ignavibacterium sp. TaxID=2651167 RepID=UPI002205CAC3|nr:T9SS type A sorting domain-containing protein [Ignavibacterium sp.]BDQ03411.1 MAG: hypothetical protein KatS3mg037_1986 [Ignavibacterium sp.]
MKRKFIFFFVFSFILFFNTELLFAQYGVRVVCDANGNQWQSDMDGNYIVWIDERDGTPQVYMYDISDSTTQQITTSSNYKYRPHISGTRVIWEEEINGETDIYIFDIANPQYGIYPLIDFPDLQFIMAFKEGKLLFRDFSCSTTGCLVYYDLNTTPPILYNITNQNDGPVSGADIEGHLVVYCMNEDIYLYNTYNSSTVQITDDEVRQQNPSISNYKVCWESWDSDDDIDIYIFDYLQYLYFNHVFYFNISKRFIEKNRSHPSNQITPCLKGKQLVFSDDYSGRYGIYNYSLNMGIVGQVTEIYSSNYNNLFPVVRDNKICWWDDKRNPWSYTPLNADVYLWLKPPGADLSVTSYFNSKSIQLNSVFTLTMLLSNLGPQTATNVQFIDSLSNKIEIISVSSNAGAIGWNSDNVIFWGTFNLPPDSSVEITITGKAILTGNASNRGSLTSDQPDYILSNNSINQLFQIRDVQTNGLGIENAGTTPKIRVDKNGFIHILTFNDYPVLVTYITNKSGSWQQEVINSSQGDLFVIGADLDVDDQGNAHIAYVISPYGPYNPNMTLYYTNNSSGQWQSTLPIGPQGGQMFSPIIRTDSNGKVHIAFMTGYFSGQIFYLNNVSGSWSSPELISDSYNSFSMDVDKNNYVHFATYNIAMNQGPVYITNSPDGQWHQPEVVEQGWTGGQMETLVLDIAVDSSNIPHISYVGDYINNEDYKYAFRINNSWQTFFVDTGGFMGGPNAIAVDNNGIPYILYVSSDNGELRYAKKVGNFFVTRNIESGMDYFMTNFFDVDCDPSNNIHFVYYKDELLYGTNSPYTINFGGGDENSGGYFFANSISDGSPSHPEYNWLDPVSFGHNIVTNWTAGDADDGYLGPVDLQFNFPFYSGSYNQIFINSNGYLSFGNGYTLTASNAIIPFVLEPNNILAACAMDLVLDGNLFPDAKIYYGIVGNKFVVTYFHAHPKLSSNDYITFQIILYPNGNILYQYNDTESTIPVPEEIANDALIGIENQYGTQGISYRNNGAGGPIFSSPLAVMFGMNSLILPVDDKLKITPDKFELFQNYPNPFNPVTTIRYSVPERSTVRLAVYNILGELVQTVVDEEKDAGTYEITFNGSNYSTGIYFCRMQAGNYVSIKKMLLLK